MFIVHTMPRHWVYLKMGLPDAYEGEGIMIVLLSKNEADCLARQHRQGRDHDPFPFDPLHLSTAPTHA